MNGDFEPMDTKSMKPEKAKKILEEQGMHVTLEEVAAILDFLNLISNIAISAYIDSKKLEHP
jgi:hypothetical protein